MLKDPGFLISGNTYRLGRTPDCSIVIEDLSISRVHAELTARIDSVLVKDLNSMNGTLVGGKKITEAEVQRNQIVVFGSVHLQLIGHELEDIAEPSTVAPADKMMSPLSEAQERVLRQLLRGCSEKEVATQLGISPNTVHAHVRAIYRKYGVNSRAELLAKFLPGGN